MGPALNRAQERAVAIEISDRVKIHPGAGAGEIREPQNVIMAKKPGGPV